MDDVGGEGRRLGGFGLWSGVALAVGLQLIPPPAELGREGWIVASTALLMATWWATEAIPIPATSLLPIIVFPLSGVLSTTAAGAAYFHPVVILLLGGFIVALTLERWNLHTRIALNVVARAGARPRMLILGFMAAAALLSMWISNTATTLMMIPIALSVAAAEEETGAKRHNFTLALVLGVAYAASIGGVATYVGTPTNLIAIGYLEQEFGRSISFTQWMAVGVPAAAVLVPAAWFVLTRWAFHVPAHAPAHAAAAEVRDRLRALGGLTVPEARVAAAFGIVAVLWILRQPLINFSGVAHLQAINGSQADAVIAIAGALAMFLIPAGGEAGRGRALMDWDTAVRLPWGVVILFGGGLSLAAGMRATGLAGWLGDQLAFLSAYPPLVVAAVIVAAIIFITELTSNVATVTAFMPVVGSIALEGGFDPVTLAAPAAIAGSCAFMLPVATAPNAIVYATGEARIADMIAAGFRLNFLAIIVIVATAGVIAQLVL